MKRKVGILLAVYAAVLAINLDTTIVNVALPSIAEELDAGTRGPAVGRRRLQPRLRRPRAGRGQPLRPLRPPAGAARRPASASPPRASSARWSPRAGALVAARVGMGVFAALIFPDDAVDHLATRSPTAGSGPPRSAAGAPSSASASRPARSSAACCSSTSTGAASSSRSRRSPWWPPASPRSSSPSPATPSCPAAGPTRPGPLHRDARPAGLHDHRGARAGAGARRRRSSASPAARSCSAAFVVVERRAAHPMLDVTPLRRPAVQRGERRRDGHVLLARRLHLPDHAVLPGRPRLRRPVDRRPHPPGGGQHRCGLDRRRAAGSPPRAPAPS